MRTASKTDVTYKQKIREQTETVISAALNENQEHWGTINWQRVQSKPLENKPEQRGNQRHLWGYPEVHRGTVVDRREIFGTQDFAN